MDDVKQYLQQLDYKQPPESKVDIKLNIGGHPIRRSNRDTLKEKLSKYICKCVIDAVDQFERKERAMFTGIIRIDVIGDLADKISCSGTFQNMLTPHFKNGKINPYLLLPTIKELLDYLPKNNNP